MICTAPALSGMKGVQGMSSLTEVGTWNLNFDSVQLYDIVVKQESGSGSKSTFRYFPQVHGCLGLYIDMNK